MSLNLSLRLSKPFITNHLVSRSLSTRCVQSGSVPDERVGSIVVPIDLSTLFEKTDTRLPGNGKPFLYTRLGNPTRSALEMQLASIAQTEYACTANNIRAAYYAMGLLYQNEKDQIGVVSSDGYLYS